MLNDQVHELLAAAVPGLAGRIEGAAQLAALMKQNSLPQVTPAAYVIGLGADAARPGDITGAHVQTVTERVAIVLVVTVADDATGGRAAVEVEGLVEAAVQGLTGAAVAGCQTPLALQRSRLVSIEAGTIFHQIDFSTTRQIRKVSP